MIEDKNYSIHYNKLFEEFIDNNLNDINNNKVPKIAFFGDKAFELFNRISVMYSWRNITICSFKNNCIEKIKECVHFRCANYDNFRKIKNKTIVFHNYFIRNYRDNRDVIDDLCCSSRHYRLKLIEINDNFINFKPLQRENLDYVFITSKLKHFELEYFYKYLKKIIKEDIFNLILNENEMFEIENRNDLIIFDSRKKKLYFVQNFI
jgi:hypothetical protein